LIVAFRLIHALVVLDLVLVINTRPPTQTITAESERKTPVWCYFSNHEFVVVVVGALALTPRINHTSVSCNNH